MFRLMAEWIAYVDESMRPESGAYLLAATCVDGGASSSARAVIGTLAKPGRRFHWRHSTPPAQAKAVGVVAELPALHLVAVATPLDPRRQERARRICLQRLLFELAGHGVSLVIMEARTQSLNKKDTSAIDAFRSARIIGPEITVQHGYPAGAAGEPLLWVPDIVAGAVGTSLDLGTPVAEQLAGLVIRYDIAL